MPALKNQHFVAKCVLRPFTVASNARAINLFNLGQVRAIPNATLKGQCARDYYYGEDGVIERLLGRLETKYGALIKRISSGGKESEGDLNNLRFFMYLQLRRTEMATVRTQFMFTLMARGVFGDEAEKMDVIPSNREIILESLETCNETHHLIADLKPRLIENRTGIDFVICDDPAVMTNRFAFQRLKYGKFGIGSSGDIFLMPLTPRLCFICYDSNVYNAVNVANMRIVVEKPADIEVINEFQYLKSAENIYFHRWKDAAYVKERYEAVRDIRLRETADIRHLVPAGFNEFGEKYVLGSREEGQQAGHSIIQVSTRHPKPTRWPSFIQFRPSPKTFYNHTAVGHVRKPEWMQGLPY